MASAHASELKQQGALEAAQDPNSSVTAEAAGDTILREAKAAGSAAFQFDPNASPEEKAAQLRSVNNPALTLSETVELINILQHIPADFHHEHKPNATALVTDIVRNHSKLCFAAFFVLKFRRMTGPAPNTTFRRPQKRVRLYQHLPQLRMQLLPTAIRQRTILAGRG